MSSARRPASRRAGTTAPARRSATPDPVRTARLQRDAAFERARSITKWIGVTSVAAVAAFAAYVSHAFPGHSSTPGGASSAVSSNQSAGVGSGSVSASSGSGSSSSNSSGVSAPAPSSQSSPVVSSGAS